MVGGTHTVDGGDVPISFTGCVHRFSFTEERSLTVLPYNAVWAEDT